MFWIASASTSSIIDVPKPWLQTNPRAFAGLWISALKNDYVVNNTTLLGTHPKSPHISSYFANSSIQGTMVEIMLSNGFQTDNPSIGLRACNILAVQSLAQLPLEVFSRKDRERIMQSWPVDSMVESAACYPAVLSLKVKVMHRPSIYKVNEAFTYLEDTAESHLNRACDSKILRALKP